MAYNAENLSIYDPWAGSEVIILYMDILGTDSKREIPIHSHDFWQLEAGVEGKIAADTGTALITLEPGDILLLPPDCPHGFMYPGGSVRWITVKFTYPAPSQKKSGLLVPGTSEYRAAFLLASLIQDSALAGSEGRIAAEGLLRSIAGVWACRYGRTVHPIRAAVDRMLEQRKGGPLTVAEAAEEIGCSAAHLSRKFRCVSGETLKRYIDSFRCSYLVKQLIYTTLTVSEIAYNTGFPDIYTFSRFIKAKTGKSPRQIRSGIKKTPRRDAEAV
ncbi:MAG: helix-turn-helix domain-containing protein [Spirochaetia bacterium]